MITLIKILIRHLLIARLKMNNKLTELLRLELGKIIDRFCGHNFLHKREKLNTSVPIFLFFLWRTSVTAKKFFLQGSSDCTSIANSCRRCWGTFEYHVSVGGKGAGPNFLITLIKRGVEKNVI